MVLCCFSDAPLEHEEERQAKNNPNVLVYRPVGAQPFMKEMYSAPCASTDACLWCVYQFNPLTCVCAQVSLRYRILDGDLSKYRFYQNQFGHLWCTPLPSSCERTKPLLSLWCESCLCNGCALSASRNVVMDTYDLRSSPADLQLIRCTNRLQALSCFCDSIAICHSSFRRLSALIDCIAACNYHSVSGCMTAQIVYELDQRSEEHFPYAPSPYWSEAVPDQGVSSGDYEPYQHLTES